MARNSKIKRYSDKKLTCKACSSSMHQLKQEDTVKPQLHLAVSTIYVEDEPKVAYLVKADAD